MANSIFVKFTDFTNTNPPTIVGESQAEGFTGAIEAHALSWGAEQALNIGSQSSGAGAGKVTFGTLQFTKDLDSTSGPLFLAMCNGHAFKEVDVTFHHTTGKGPDSILKLGLVALKSIDLSASDDVPVENVALEYGTAVWVVAGKSSGWNRVTNVSATTVSSTIAG
jgi:type VI secretion system Hcp family effector